MENGVTHISYLHKKFKKQLSVEPRVVARPAPPLPPAGGDERVPNPSSTNERLPPIGEPAAAPAPNHHESSESLRLNCITYPNTSSDQHHHRPVLYRPPVLNFDTPFNDQSSNNHTVDPTEHDDDAPKVAPLLPDKNSSGGKYVCAYCNLACTKPSVLQKHIRAHTNERPYPCVSCGFSFKTRSNLYKHCRSRTHANRVLGNRANEPSDQDDRSASEPPDYKSKVYKPRFHDVPKENDDANPLSHHINELITKNHSIVNTYPHRTDEPKENNNDYSRTELSNHLVGLKLDEPLNLTYKRKRCVSEATEPLQKSLIKELLLKNLSSDMQCPHCKMIFQTVTELELHKLRSCKGFVKPGERYVRSNSVNVASILTQRDDSGAASLPLKSPGPFLGKTRLVEADKAKSFSFEDGLSSAFSTYRPNDSPRPLAPLAMDIEKKGPIKLFGGEVRIAAEGGASERPFEASDVNEYKNVSENRVVKSSLHSGGTVLTNYADNPTPSPRPAEPSRFPFDHSDPDRKRLLEPSICIPSNKYNNIVDFSQNAVKLLTPNLKQPSLAISSALTRPLKIEIDDRRPPAEPYHPVNLLVDGKVIRYVPGIPGPVVAEGDRLRAPEIRYDQRSPKSCEMRSPVIKRGEAKTPPKPVEAKRFARPNSLALKPSTAASKQHHGLTPTMFNQILISPDTPRVSKKYIQQYLNGNYFSYLGLKSTTKPVYCTLNKTQPFYVPHFKKLSMYSEWRQQDTKTDRLYVAAYDSRQKSSRYTVAGLKSADMIVHSSYKFTVPDKNKDRNDDGKKTGPILGGYECNEDYTYIRGRGRGRYVCEQCGIRCKKPSMLKKHIRTHSNDRPYTCSHCNFSFKTKGNLTKHMKSKVHTKNTTVNGSSSSSTQQSGTQSSDTDTDDSGMDSSDESTRQQEHEAAYGLLSLSQKSTHSPTPGQIQATMSPTSQDSKPESSIMDTEEIAYVTKTNYAKNKILGQPSSIRMVTIKDLTTSAPDEENNNDNNQTSRYLGRSNANRPLTYPYSDAHEERMSVSSDDTRRSESISSFSPEGESKIKQFQVIQKYAPPIIKTVEPPAQPVVEKLIDFRKRKINADCPNVTKLQKNDEVMDLSQKKAEGVVSNGIERNFVPEPAQPVEFDNSAMETLADVATRQVKLERNAMARSVASEFLKLATKREAGSREEPPRSIEPRAEVSELIVKSEGSKNCPICLKNFSKPSQLRLHMNVHYLERPFRCESCSVSFRTKGHLQKHERSASHNNKLSSSPALLSSEPRPFKCTDCNIAFRIHGHLAKHLRSKMHIMKLECLAKIPFGLYAELERANSLLTEINTADGEQCLESLKTLAKKVFSEDPDKTQRNGVS